MGNLIILLLYKTTYFWISHHFDFNFFLLMAAKQWFPCLNKEKKKTEECWSTRQNNIVHWWTCILTVLPRHKLIIGSVILLFEFYSLAILVIYISLAKFTCITCLSIYKYIYEIVVNQVYSEWIEIYSSQVFTLNILIHHKGKKYRMYNVKEASCLIIFSNAYGALS